MLGQGKGVNEVARLVGASSSSVSGWKRILRRRGPDGLKAKPHPGREPGLNAAKKRRLVALLKKGTVAAGYPNDLRTCRRVADRHVGAPLIVVQDRLNVHKAAVRSWPSGRPAHAPRAMVEWLPSYAPELNPAEQLWNHGKRVDLANLAPLDSRALRGHVRRSLIRQRHRPNLLASFFDHAGLPL